MNGTLRKEYVENSDAARTMIHSRRKVREDGKAAADAAATEGVYKPEGSPHSVTS